MGLINEQSGIVEVPKKKRKSSTAIVELDIEYKKLENQRKDAYANDIAKPSKVSKLRARLEDKMTWAAMETSAYIETIPNAVPTPHTHHVDAKVIVENLVKRTIECKYGSFNVGTGDWRFNDVLEKLFTDASLQTIHPECPDNLVLLTAKGYSDLDTKILIPLFQSGQIMFNGKTLRVHSNPTAPHRKLISRLFWDNFVYY